MLYPMKLKAPLKDYLWGGTRLKEEYGKSGDLEKVAESWELSCHKDGQSIIENGEAAGQTLAAYIEAQGHGILGPRGGKEEGFPILVKFIDAKDNLSVQVHPDNEYAWRVEGEPGKTEMWYVVDAEPGAQLIYGFRQEISREEFARRIEDNTLLEVCRQVPVKKGDTFFIASGTLHAIGAGALICEIQQSSNTTYRVYDYGRKGADGRPRELHIEKALAVTRREPLELRTEPVACLHGLVAGADIDLLASCEYFTVYHIALQDEIRLAAPEESFQAVTVLSGTVAIKSGSGEVTLAKGETAFLPVGLGAYSLRGTGELLLSEA